jgi:hypothetical protein
MLNLFISALLLFFVRPALAQETLSQFTNETTAQYNEDMRLAYENIKETIDDVGNLTNNVTVIEGNLSTTAGAGKIPVEDASGYLPDSCVDIGALKTATGTVSISSNGAVTLPGGEYAFFPQYKVSSDTGDSVVHMGFDSSASSFTTQVGMHIHSGGSTTVEFQSRYITSSGEDWWIFLLIDKGTKEILASYSAPDHPCYGNGGDPEQTAHPFASLYNETKHDIILLDKDTCNALRDENKRSGKTVLEIITKQYEIDMRTEKKYVPLHSGKFLDDNGKQIKQMVDSIPDYITVRGLIKK